MRNFAYSLLIFLATILFLFTTTQAQQDERNSLLRYVEAKYISMDDLSSTLSDLARFSNVPIGFEPEEFSENKTFKLTNHEMTEEIGLKLRNGNLENILMQITDFYPNLRWTYENGVVNVSPINKKDSVISEILKVEVNTLLIEKRIGVMSAGEYIAESSEVKSKLKFLGVKDIHFYNSIESTKLDGKSLKQFFVIENKSVKDILNLLIRESNSKFWTMIRWGNKGEFLTIVVS